MIVKSSITIFLRTQALKQCIRTSTPSRTFVNQNLRDVMPSVIFTSTNENDDTRNSERCLTLCALCAPGTEACSINEHMTGVERLEKATLKYKTNVFNSTPKIKNGNGTFHVTYVEPNVSK